MACTCRRRMLIATVFLLACSQTWAGSLTDIDTLASGGTFFCLGSFPGTNGVVGQGTNAFFGTGLTRALAYSTFDSKLYVAAKNGIYMVDNSCTSSRIAGTGVQPSGGPPGTPAPTLPALNAAAITATTTVFHDLMSVAPASANVIWFTHSVDDGAGNADGNQVGFIDKAANKVRVCFDKTYNGDNEWEVQSAAYHAASDTLFFYGQRYNIAGALRGNTRLFYFATAGSVTSAACPATVLFSNSVLGTGYRGWGNGAFNSLAIDPTASPITLYIVKSDTAVVKVIVTAPLTGATAPFTTSTFATLTAGDVPKGIAVIKTTGGDVRVIIADPNPNLPNPAGGAAVTGVIRLFDGAGAAKDSEGIDQVTSSGKPSAGAAGPPYTLDSPQGGLTVVPGVYVRLFAGWGGAVIHGHRTTTVVTLPECNDATQISNCVCTSGLGHKTVANGVGINFCMYSYSDCVPGIAGTGFDSQLAVPVCNCTSPNVMSGRFCYLPECADKGQIVSGTCRCVAAGHSTVAAANGNSYCVYTACTDGADYLVGGIPQCNCSLNVVGTKCTSASAPTPTPTPSPSPIAIATPTPTPSPTQSPSATPTASPTPTAVPQLQPLQIIQLKIDSSTFTIADAAITTDPKDGKTKLITVNAPIVTAPAKTGIRDRNVVITGSGFSTGEPITLLILDPNDSTKNVSAINPRITSSTTIEFQVDKLPGARRALLQFAPGALYNLRIDPISPASTMPPFVLIKSFQWTDTTSNPPPASQDTTGGTAKSGGFNTNNTAIILGVVLGVGGFFVIAAIAAYFVLAGRRRRQHMRRDERDQPAPYLTPARDNHTIKL